MYFENEKSQTDFILKTGIENLWHPFCNSAFMNK